MKLPNAEHAVVDIEKLRDYCLNATHPRGKHKATVFVSVLGITANEAEILRVQILSATLGNEAFLLNRMNTGNDTLWILKWKIKVEKRLSVQVGSSVLQKIFRD